MKITFQNCQMVDDCLPFLIPEKIIPKQKSSIFRHKIPYVSWKILQRRLCQAVLFNTIFFFGEDPGDEVPVT